MYSNIMEHTRYPSSTSDCVKFQHTDHLLILDTQSYDISWPIPNITYYAPKVDAQERTNMQTHPIYYGGSMYRHRGRDMSS